ncbi:MAG: AMP-binding protein [Steroidobacteraceae bacterium]
MDSNASFVQGDTSVGLLYRTVDDLLRAAAQQWPQRPALVVHHQQRRLTFRELDNEVERLARGLSACAMQPGDRLGLWSANNTEWVLTMFAAARVGLVLVNINPAYRSSELQFALSQAGCRGLITASSFKSSDYIGMLRALIPEVDRAAPGHLRSAALPQLQLLVQLSGGNSPGFLSFAELLSAGDRPVPPGASQQPDPDDPYNIQFTSGTTGLPKGATLTHFNVVNNGFFVGEALRLTPEDKVCIPVPMYHCFGMVLGVLAAMTHGAASVFPGEGFDPLATLETVHAERCTALHGVPTMFIAELEQPRFREFDLSSLRTGIMAGAPCPVAVMQRVIDDMHMREITIAYGMTETSPVSFQSTTDDPIARRVSSVGKVHPHVQVKIVDEQGRVVPMGTPGELCTRGYSVMLGYWGEPERTKEVLDSAGWMHTGDLAVLDAEGYCNVVGRVKDMIIRGGENVSPREIEEFLYRHPAVLDVAVVGVPDRKYGEEICACIRLKGGMSLEVEQVREFCRDRIAHYKIPRYVRCMETFPMTVTGKVQKYLLRERMRQELGFEEESRA